MAFGGFSKSGGQQPIAEINMVPLIDVMLVLLVIFIVTAPLLTHAVKIDLPKATSSISLAKPDKIELAIDAGGTLYWNGEAVDKATVMARFASEARKTPQPELHLRADRNTRYQMLAEVMAEAAKVGLSKIGFVSEPEKDLSLRSR